MTLFGQLAKFVIQMTGLFVLARLLTPEEYGLYGMVLVFTGIGALIGDFGLASASIQVSEISGQQRTNLFWVNLGLGVVTTSAFLALAGPLATLYGVEQLAIIIVVAASVFVVQGATTQFAANATRELRFGLLAFSEVVSQLVGLLVAVGAALAGSGVWALVAQQIAVAITIFLVLTVASRWRPGLPRRAPMRRLFVYGANTFGVQVLSFVTAKTDSFIVGKFLGVESLGIYDRGYQLNQIPTQQLATPLTRVALPLLARHQDDQLGMQTRLVSVARAMAYALGGAILFMGANSAAVVAIVLGSQWGAVAPILAILTIGGFFQAVGYVYYWAFLALGKTGVQLRFALVTRPAMIVFIIAGAFFGLTGVAIGVSAGLLVNWIVLSILALPKVGLRPFPIAAPILRALVMWAVSSWGTFALMDILLVSLPAVLSVAVNGLTTLFFASSFLVFRAYRSDLRSLRTLIERRGT